MTLTLTNDEYDLILLALGYTTGSASRQPIDATGVRLTLTAANAFGKAGGGNFRPYDVEAEVAALTRNEPAT